MLFSCLFSQFIIFFSWTKLNTNDYSSLDLKWPIAVGWMITLSVIFVIAICMVLDALFAPGENWKEASNFSLFLT